MQESLTNQKAEKGRSGGGLTSRQVEQPTDLEKRSGYGTGHFIPKSFLQETQELFLFLAATGSWSFTVKGQFVGDVALMWSRFRDRWTDRPMIWRKTI